VGEIANNALVGLFSKKRERWKYRGKLQKDDNLELKVSRIS
jgi:hypothetical protein